MLLLRYLPAVALALAIPGTAFAQNSLVSSARTSEGSRALLQPTLAHLPLSFEPDQAGNATAARYITHVAGLPVEISAAGLELHLPRVPGSLRLELLGSDPRAAMAAEVPGGGQSNYLLGDAKSWKTNIRQLDRIGFESIYPGIDVAYYGTGGRLEHDFIVHPGADASRIRIRFQGARKLRLNAAGELLVDLPQGELVEQAPRIYQMLAGKRVERTGHFVLHAGNEVSFAVSGADKRADLIIDPVLDYSTYLANSASATSLAVATDAAGNTYITGVATSTYAATAGAFQATCCASGQETIFITKLNATGTGVIYTTYLGGASASSQPAAIAVDGNGDAVVTGWTNATDFPTKNPFSTLTVSSQDGFISSLSPDGSSLIFSSRLGGAAASSSSSTYPGAVAVDASGNVYITGTTQGQYPVTSGALNAGTPSYTNNYAFLTKLTKAGALVFSAIPGNVGETSECCSVSSLAVDSTGAVFIAGTVGGTLSGGPTPWPTTSGAFQPTLSAPLLPAPFVSKIKADGSAFIFSTLFGSGNLVGIVLDASDEPILAGNYGSGIPVTTNGYSTATSGTSFLGKLSADGSTALYGSYFAPNGTDAGVVINGVALDPSGDVWIAGTNSRYGSGTLPLVNPIQPSSNYNGSGFVTEFDPLLRNVLFSTHISGNTQSASVTAIANDTLGRAHIIGLAGSDLPTTPSVYIGTVPVTTLSTYYPYAAMIDATVAAPALCLASAVSAIAQVGSSATASETISNCGNAPLTINAVQASGTLFSLNSAHSCITTLSPGATCTISATFTPTAAGNYSASLTISSNTQIATSTGTLYGYGTAPKIQIYTPSIAFSPELFTSLSDPASAALIVNSGQAPLSITATTINGSAFTIASSTCTKPLNPGVGCVVSVAFTPPTAGSFTGTLTITSNDPVTPTATILLTGSALSAYPAPTLTGLSTPTVPIGSTSLTVSGSNFFAGSIGLIDGQPVTTTYNGPSSLSLTLPASVVAGLGEHTVTVYTPMPGGGQSAPLLLTVYQIYPATLYVSSLASAQGLLYAAIPQVATNNPNTVVPINPATGAQGAPIPVGRNPQLLATSSDGSYLYVANAADQTVQRINLATQAVERTFPFPAYTVCGTSCTATAGDLQAVPGQPKEVVLAFGEELALYNDSGLVNYAPSALTYLYTPTLTSIAMAGDPVTIYALPFTDAQNSFFYTAQIGAAGISYVPYSGTNYGAPSNTGAQVVSDGSLLYTNSGAVWNPSTQKQVGTFSANTYYYSFERSLAVDTNGLYVFGDETLGSTSEDVLTAWNKQTLAISGTLAFPSINAVEANYLVRWGTNGFAFLNGTTLYTFTSSLATAANANPLPVLQALVPNSVSAGGSAFQLTLSGSGFTANSTVLLNETPLAVAFSSSAQLTATVPASAIGTAGTVFVTVSNPAPGGGTSAAQALTIVGAGAPSLTFSVPNNTFGAAPFAVQATSNSAGAITFAVVSGPATISGSTVTLTGAGTVILRASQAAAGAYSAGSAMATFSVAQATPVITWVPQNSTLGSGVSLGSGVLDATANTAGTFTYSATPQAGGSTLTVSSATVLPSGAYTLAASFQPADSVDYLPAATTRMLTILTQHLWIVSGIGSVFGIDDGGNPLGSPSTLGGGSGIAIDASGSIWSVNSGGSSLSVFSSSGALLHSSISGGGLSGGTALAIDGNGDLWAVGSGNSLAEFSNAGAPLSPSTGFSAGQLSAPSGVAVDLSGNVWISNSGSASVTKVLGGAVPVAPMANGVTSNTLGVKP